jgi:SET domain-containing protein
LLKEDHFRVKESNIHNAGRGLFATDNIAPNVVIGEYSGPIIPNDARDPDDHYQFEGTNPRVTITSRDPMQSTVTRFINEANRRNGNNVKFTNSRVQPCHRDNYAAFKVKTLKRIKATKENPKELLIDYGGEYWR